jgi:hypothetical protein
MLYICCVPKFRKHIAAFLLSVFCLGILPAPLLHDILSNHTDAADNHCQYYHKALGTHVEEKQEHCPVFHPQTPLYDAVTVKQELNPTFFLISEHKLCIAEIYFSSSLSLLPARAPPVS